MFYFAWCDYGPFGPEHQVYDENVFSFTVTGREAEIAQLLVTIRNPRVGLLNAGRKIYCWLSHWDGESTEPTPIFHGRLVGIPSDVFAEMVTLTFLAKPPDYAAQRRDLANSMAVLPYYDPLFIDPDLRITDTGGDVDAVLEGYPQRWHCSRGEDGGTLTVTASDIVIGEDGTEDFGPSGVPYDGISLTLDGTPLLSVNVNAQVPWTQSIPGALIDLGSHYIPTYTGASLVSDWPKPGVSLGGGWMAAPGTGAIDVYRATDVQTQTSNYNWQNTAKQHSQGDTMSVRITDTEVIALGPAFKQLLTYNSQPGVIGATVGEEDQVNIPLHVDATWITVPQSLVYTNLKVSYETGRARTEHLTFTMLADVQAVLTDPGDYDTAGGGSPSDAETIEITGADITIPIDGVAPLSDPGIPNYFPTDRGLQSVEYLLLRARARLLAGSRIVRLSWNCSFERALLLTCRKNASLTDHRLPGGIASGKIVEYTIFADGNTGKLGGTVTVACSIGHAGIIVAAAGEPIYCDADYVDSDYQEYTGEVSIIGDDIGYAPPVASLDPEFQLPLTKSDIVISETIHGSAETQLDIIEANAAAWFKNEENTVPQIPINYTYNGELALAQATAAAEAAKAAQDELDSNAVWYELQLKTVDELALENAIELQVEPLKVPKTIDLEAASTP